jgi:hypothetical protein
MYLSDKSCVQYHKGKGMRSYFFVKGNWVWDNFTLRELVSKESWLWQFVCENGMCTAGERPHRWKFYEELFPDYEAQTYANNMIIESALCDEDKLEEFLLENIKVE